ncbi:MAG TPA: Asp-tRNA(Asn)/Glu-tRNA(Gln) amidotransferase subunit GatC [Casimicrobiaceae bacterium]
MSHSFSRADVARIAALARLEINETEVDLFQRQIAGILEHAERIQEVNTDGVPPYASTLKRPDDRDDTNGLRDDVAVISLSPAEALRNAPLGDRASGTFVVPKVIG